jgi:5'-nucleotidase
LPNGARGALLAALAAAAWLIPVGAPARLVEIRVLHTTDLHGHILPTRDYNGRKDVGGLLRGATLLRKLRAEREHVLLLDCGDLYQGSVESLLTEGRIMTRALDALGYDAWILGNHEFDWGLDKLVARQGEATTPVLAANIVTREGRPQPLTRVQPFLLREFEGVKVAVVGLITPGVPSWSLPDLLGDLEFQRSVAALQRVMPAVRAAAPDVILLATHQGWRAGGDDHANEVNEIARQFPEITAIIGGHSHVVEETRLVDGVLFTQAGYYGVWLGCLDLAYDTVARKVVRREPKIWEVGDQYAPDEELGRLLESDLARARTYAAEVVGRAADDLTAVPDARGGSPVQRLICKAIAGAVDAEIVFHGTLSQDPIPAGPITRAAIMEVVPYENRIGVALLTPAEILAIVEENARRRGTINHMGIWGLKVVDQPDGTRVLRLPDDTAPHPRKRFRVAFNSYVLASGGRRFPRLREICAAPEARLQITAVDTRAAVTEFVRRHSPLRTGDLGP